MAKGVLMANEVGQNSEGPDKFRLDEEFSVNTK
jgi:hypothetical protein